MKNAASVDWSLLPPTFSVHDRQVTLPSGTDLSDMSLYAVLRSWAHDDPATKVVVSEGSHPNALQCVRAMPVGTLDNDEKVSLLVPADKVVADINTLFQTQHNNDADADRARRLNGIVSNAKKVRNRANLLRVAHYSRVKDRLAVKGIPSLAALESILEECASLTPPRSQPRPRAE